MNKCKICGQDCGIYDICRECQKDIQNGKVKLCPNCNKYYITQKGHQCYRQNASENKYTSYGDYEYQDCDNSYEEYARQKYGEYTQQNCDEYEPPEHEKSTFRKAAEGTAGAGCGCVLAIIIAVALLIGIIYGLIQTF